jgi:anaerobic magnesium-protoporphyrin IX monomethyl ester cyclase
MLSLVNVMFGIEEERPATLWRTFRGLFALDPDIVNAVYLTPHHWAAEGRGVDPATVIQPDLARFTYRNQVLATRMAPWLLFAAVKAIEVLFHARPRALRRLLFEGDTRLRRILRAYVGVGLRVWIAEWVELLRTPLVRPGTLHAVPGYPAAKTARERASA